jgi:predicted phosphoadenosine phosphosulfate sulfurtransferase
MVDPNLFEGDYRVIAERCIAYWKKYNIAPAAHLDDELSDILDDGHNRKAPTFRRIMVAMVHLNEEINVGYVIDKLTTFVRMQKLKSAILTSAEQLNKKQEMAVEEIEAIWDSLLRDLNSLV